jgi:hypothetical protein
MKLIQRYRVLEASSMEDLPRKVNGLIENGWQPYGPLVFASLGNDSFWAQPMVKYRDASPEAAGATIGDDPALAAALDELIEGRAR